MKKIPAILDCVAKTSGVQIVGLSLLVDLFLWMAGIGVHLFWLIALYSQWQDVKRAPAISEKSA